jgi:hypothetical protein
MIDWEGMFASVQEIVRTAEDTADGIQRTCAFAAQYRDEYDEPEFWERVTATKFPFDTLETWIQDGLNLLDSPESQSLLVLDCGDCPDGLWLGNSLTPSAERFREFEQFAKSNVVVAGEDFARAGIKDVQILTNHLVIELNHPILSYLLFDRQWHGTNGYLLWLAVASLALCHPLRDPNFCRQILSVRESLLLMSGYEEIFFYLGTVTADGLSLA